MLSPARIVQREEAIKDMIYLRMKEEIDDFFDWLDEGLTFDNFSYKLKRHTLYTVILMLNKESIEEDIDELWRAYVSKGKFDSDSD